MICSNTSLNQGSTHLIHLCKLIVVNEERIVYELVF